MHLAFDPFFANGEPVGFRIATTVGLEPVSGDFDNDGDVDGRDFLTWRRGGPLEREYHQHLPACGGGGGGAGESIHLGYSPPTGARGDSDNNEHQ